MKIKTLRTWWSALVLMTGAGWSAMAGEATAPVVFVCDHGSVKSVMAALFFNRLAAEANLPQRAISRGLTPDEKIPEAVAAALRKEGFDLSGITPQRLSSEEGASAATVVGFCRVPVELADATKTTLWLEVPPVSVDYAKARAVMLPLVSKLVTDLKAEQPPAKTAKPGGS